MESLQHNIRRMPRLTGLLVSACLFTPAFAAVVECGEEHFVSGEHRLPTRTEALAQCRAEEAAMTDSTSGTYTRVRSCYDADEPGEYGAWVHGRVALDVKDRHTGQAATFESLWMCKPSIAPEQASAAVD